MSTVGLTGGMRDVVDAAQGRRPESPLELDVALIAFLRAAAQGATLTGLACEVSTIKEVLP
ncbi:hypothetical protein FHP25_33950 [Vineibacter terrae]|uniref:Uncharacterized protein n=1 Tax=Vineibacter terrae TaxID=2586908 RepID=A0A5C8P9U3_9HYPH|nr:hypothetical protein [Vineibacter terrae]TXL70541.1 hypothetical protein FHP25_33950 [Vineibacter terrae]